MAEPIMDLVIEDGGVVHETGRFIGSVGIKGGKIAALRNSWSSARLRGKRTIDARGKLVLPGVIDVHVHMQMPLAACTLRTTLRAVRSPVPSAE